jgi:uncharacterized protein
MTTAIVTGASSGIGLELARLLAKDGHDVVLVARSETKLRDLADELGPKTRIVTADLSKPEAAATIVAQVPEADVLVNNAGIGDFGPFAEADLAKTLGMIQLNITSLTELTHRYLPGMVQRGNGRIMNVASTAAFQPGPLMAVYYATKAYVLSFSEAIFEELRGSGVTVTALCPGPTESGFQAGAEMEASRLVRDKKLPTSLDVATFGHAAMLKGDPVAVHGLRNKALASSVRFTPRPVIRRLVHRLSAAH